MSSVLVCELVKSGSLVRFKRKWGAVETEKLETAQRLVSILIGR